MMIVVDVRAVPAESRESRDHERARLAATIAAGCTLAAVGAVVAVGGGSRAGCRGGFRTLTEQPPEACASPGGFTGIGCCVGVT